MTGEPPPDAAAEIERFAAELLNQPISELRRQIRRLMGERVATQCPPLDALEVALLKARDATDGRGQKVLLSTHSARAAAAQMAWLPLFVFLVPTAALGWLIKQCARSGK